MKRAIVVVSFGTANKEVRKSSIGVIEGKIRDEFLDYKVIRAFTSKTIIKKIKDIEDVDIPTPSGALEWLKKGGYDEVIVQPLHIIAGLEYHEIALIVNKYKLLFKRLILGKPILFNIDDYNRAIYALKSQLPTVKEGQGVLLMGHGSNHPSNSSYSCLQLMINDEDLPVYVATLKGYPSLENVINKLKRDNINEVILMPYMVVSGKHVRVDMAGDGEDSWKNILLRKGFKVKIYPQGLGENNEYVNIYVENVRELIVND